MDCSTLGFPVFYYLLQIAQAHVCWVGDAIQPSHPLLSPSPPAFNLSQHQGLFQWVSSSHQVAKGLELQHQSFHSNYYLSEGPCVFDKLRLIISEVTKTTHQRQLIKLPLSLGVQSPLAAVHKVEPHTAEWISKQHRTSQSCGETGPGTGPGSTIC